MGADMDGAMSLKKKTDDIAQKWSGSFHFETGTGVKYSATMEFGSKRHVITPNTKQALRFYVDGIEVITREVDHPGTEPRPYMRPGAEGAVRRAPALLARVDDLESFTEALADEVRKIASRIAPKKTGKLAASITVRRIG